MGDFELVLATLSVVLLGAVIYVVINILTFKDLLRRFGLLKLTRRDFYECGFKPPQQRTIKVSLQFLLICIFFLIYDIELVFLFPFISSYTFITLYDLFLLIDFFSIFVLSLMVDYERHALTWQE